jgi:hypothetical protein
MLKESSYNQHFFKLSQGHKNFESEWSIDNGKEINAYGSIFNRMAEAVGDSETLYEYLRKATNILYYTPAATLFILSLLVYHLAELTIGKFFFD